MPETAYVQQAISTTLKPKKQVDCTTRASNTFVIQMQKQMQEHIYNYTRSNLGF